MKHEKVVEVEEKSRSKSGGNVNIGSSGANSSGANSSVDNGDGGKDNHSRRTTAATTGTATTTTASAAAATGAARDPGPGAPPFRTREAERIERQRPECKGSVEKGYSFRSSSFCHSKQSTAQLVFVKSKEFKGFDTSFVH